MLISKQYISPIAQQLILSDALVNQAFDEVSNSIIHNVSPGQAIFALNNSQKNCNGVVPIKERCYQILEESYDWFREKPLSYFHNDVKKGGPIDVYKEFSDTSHSIHAGLEFETGNISSAHRLLADYPFVVFGFSAESYSPVSPLLPKGKDGMSARSIHRWKNK